MVFASYLSASYCHSQSIQLEWRLSCQVKFKDPTRGDDQEFCRVMIVTRETSNFGEGATACSVDYFRKIRKQYLKCEKHIDKCNVGAGDWLVHNFVLIKDCGFVNYQTPHRGDAMHPPVNMTQMMRSILGSTRSAWSVVIHQTQHNRALKCQTSLGRIVGGNTHKHC